MNVDVPSTWLRCGPFPQFTDLERAFFRALQDGAGELQSIIEAQVSACKVTDRWNTHVGFYTSLVVDTARAPPVPSYVGRSVVGGGGSAEVEQVEGGLLGFLLFFEDGYLTCLEGYTFGVSETPDDLTILRLGKHELSLPSPP